MHSLIIKSSFACSIFLLSVVSGWLPARVRTYNKRFLGISNAFASGVFLGAALLHLLPDAVSKFELFYAGDYPLVYLICIVTFILLLVMERLVNIYDERVSSNSIAIPAFLISLLTIHSLIEGATIGVSSNILEATTIFVAVFVHKGSESFALAVSLNRFKVKTATIKKTIVLFSLMTPLGILTTSTAGHFFSGILAEQLTAVLNAVAAGTFLYLGTEHLVEGEKSFEKAYEIATLSLGVAVMAIVAGLV